jgi:uncharacterized protein YecT (DUF1311 family)
MRSRPTHLVAAVAAAMLLSLGPATADEATINACLKTEHAANRSGRDCIGRMSDHCLQLPGNESTTSMVQCVDEETKVWDGLLNADYQRLLGALGDKAAESVRQAERAWIAARDADCQVPYDIYDGGSMARLDSANCVLDHTAARVLQLRIWHEMAHPE